MRITPSMQQYLDLKKAYPDCILLFQMGDFYETFFDDAKTIAKELNIILTSREKNNQIPMAGFPIKALATYLPKLIKKGYKVAIAEQIEDPSTAKGLVKRKVVEVVTSATYLGDQTLTTTTQHNIGTLVKDPKTGLITISFAAILGQTIFLTKLPPNHTIILDFVQTQQIQEVILPQSQLKYFSTIVKQLPYSTIKISDNLQQLEKEISDHFGVSNLMALGLEENLDELISIKLLLSYFEYLKGTEAKNITKVQFINYKNRMYLDSMTLQNLEILENTSNTSLFNILNKSSTPMGTRFLSDALRAPLKDKNLITERLNYIEFLIHHPQLLNMIKQHLINIFDIERITGLLGLKRIKPKHARQLANSLQSVLKIITIIEKYDLFKPILKDLTKKTTEEIIHLIDFYIEPEPTNSPSEGPIINANNFSELKDLRNVLFNTQAVLDSHLNKLKQDLRIDKLKVGFNKIYGYYFEVPKTHANKIPDVYPRKQTLVNSVRFITPQLQEFEQKIQMAEEQLILLENKYYQEFLNKIIVYIQQLQQISNAIAYLDFLVNGATIATKFNYNKPQITQEKLTIIKEGRHPVIEQLTDEFISNDIVLDKDKTFVILTGPNMGGKSTFIRQIALIQLLAQVGYFVPASKAKLSIKDRIFARVGASDNISKGLSTFMVEMSEVATIINNATSDSLIILDEVGRGTSTLEGIALAQAISEYIINQLEAHTLFATHFYELTQLEQQYKNVINLKVDVFEENENVVFLHKVSKGPAEKSYGIHIAQMVNLPTEIIQQAKKYLLDLNQQRINLRKLTYKKPVPKKSQNILQPTLLTTGPDPKYQQLVKTIKNLDINTTTPIKALEILNKLQKLILE